MIRGGVLSVSDGRKRVHDGLAPYIAEQAGRIKAALEATARYLAFDLGLRKIRVNTISAGPVKTLSAMAVGGIDEMFSHFERKAPLHRNIDGDEVGKTAVYLLSDLSSGVTGENLFVDSGFNTVGL
jgi:enoyl-[acyl-carrier protein] reductase I